MALKLLFDVTFDGSWIAKRGDVCVSADSLIELDRKIEEKLKELGYRGEVGVHMWYDVRSIPVWLRQYQSHYFHRVVKLKLE